MVGIKSSKKIFIRIKHLLKPLITPQIPKGISRRFKPIDQKGMVLIEESLRHNYFSENDAWFGKEYLSSPSGNNDLLDHLHRRLNNFRNLVIPWLNTVKPLTGSKILEIGCGTGSSTVALAEQGASVTAVDIMESSIQVAKDRCNAYSLSANFLCENATELHKILAGQSFDFIIFFATLEHMTHQERMISMRNTWEMLLPGNYWCLIDTPNRLWYFDDHTSLLPFYHWLPDDLAFEYSRFSSRQNLSGIYREMNDDTKLEFLRKGRGVSFHEFDLTMKRAESLDVVSSLSIYLINQNLWRRMLLTPRKERQFASFLTRSGPKIHPGFYQRSLDLIIRKN
jgi:2-polyprenyl-3-methyl-5-hydroxy-6-metoxy-1,4-benzoquinol methylase